MKKKILCMGSINIDLVMYAAKLPRPGETVVTDNFQTFPGGKGGNQAVAASVLGGDVKYFTKLGSDEFSRQLSAAQRENGVAVEDILYIEGETAGIAMIMVDESAQNLILFTPGANQLLTPEDVRNSASVFDGCDILEITMEILPETVYEAIRIAKSKNMTVILDPAPAPKNGIPKEIACMVDYIKPNETEAEILTGVPVTDTDSAIGALKILQEMGFAVPIISLGEKGAVTISEGDVYIEKPLPVKSVDTTAAGDIFLGAFTAALSSEKAFGECLEYAKTAAALSTMKKGAQASIPTRDEVEAYLNRRDHSE